MNHELFALGALIPLFFIMLAIILIPTIFYILTLQKALKRCAPENQAMPPENIWLLLIPVFSIVWQFIVVTNMAKSLAAEFNARKIHTDEVEPGKSLGLAYCILNCCTIIPILGLFAGIAGIICWILYWVKIDNYSAMISMPPPQPGAPE